MISMDSPPPHDTLLTEWRQAEEPQKRAAADRLFATYYERVARWCFRFTGDREAALDLAQEVFLKAHRSLESFRGGSQFGTWLYSIVRNEALNRMKRGSIATESEEALIAVPALDPNPEEQAAAQSRSRRLHRFLHETLDDTERTVFTLHYGEDVPLDAITRMLRLENSSGAKAYIVSAKRKLSRAVEKLFVRGEKL
jgi:RNA polymerase sigma-70 factor (ECF subfamily)